MGRRARFISEVDRRRACVLWNPADCLLLYSLFSPPPLPPPRKSGGGDRGRNRKDMRAANSKQLIIGIARLKRALHQTQQKYRVTTANKVSLAPDLDKFVVAARTAPRIYRRVHLYSYFLLFGFGVCVCVPSDHFSAHTHFNTSRQGDTGNTLLLFAKILTFFIMYYFNWNLIIIIIIILNCKYMPIKVINI